VIPCHYQLSMLQVKDIKFVIYGLSLEESDVDIHVTQYVKI
jgi:hypothetical protein